MAKSFGFELIIYRQNSISAKNDVIFQWLCFYT